MPLPYALHIRRTRTNTNIKEQQRMHDSNDHRLNSYLNKAKQTGVKSVCLCREIVLTQLYPATRHCSRITLRICRHRLLPVLRTSSIKVRNELLKIHQQQNWIKRFGGTMLDNAAGLIMAMLAARIVQNFVEVSEFSNLWGLLASRPVVTETTYEVLNFGVEFIIALITFTLTEHYISEYRKNSSEAAESTDQS